MCTFSSRLMRQRVDLGQAQRQGQFVFVDGFSQLFLPISSSTSGSKLGNCKTWTLTSRSPWSTQLSEIIVQALGEVKGEKPSLFIEGLDLLLAAGQDSITANEIIALVSSLSEVSPPRPLNTNHTDHFTNIRHPLRR